MSISKKRISLTVVMLVGFASLIAGVFVAQHLPEKKVALAQQFKGTLLDHPRSIKPFALTGTDGEPFTNQSLQGHWTMIFYGFTNCATICPTTMAELGQMYRFLEKNKVDPLPEVVMVSIDPERDSLLRLANYVKAFDPHFSGARGDDKAVHKMARGMGIVYMKAAADRGNPQENYTIQHSGAVMLFNPQGELAAFFTPPNTAEEIAHDYELVVS
ncbi:MAG: photosynthetic protein synthase I [Legionellales bacterium RIFCSPHIGHO2_12_FULL_42_9]|nr:MAG: photosynthetic protein synthase I [Legionellales bacterium RIFCSPHIGHO2_12_FULL_42_9]